MNVQLILLRRNGVRLDVPHFRDLKDVPPSWVLSGMMGWGAANGSQGKSLNLSDFRSTPGFGIKAQLFQPSVVDAQHDYIKLRGFEPVKADGSSDGHAGVAGVSVLILAYDGFALGSSIT